MTCQPAVGGRAAHRVHVDCGDRLLHVEAQEEEAQPSVGVCRAIRDPQPPPACVVALLPACVALTGRLVEKQQRGSSPRRKERLEQLQLYIGGRGMLPCTSTVYTHRSHLIRTWSPSSMNSSASSILMSSRSATVDSTYSCLPSRLARRSSRSSRTFICSRNRKMPIARQAREHASAHLVLSDSLSRHQSLQATAFPCGSSSQMSTACGGDAFWRLRHLLL